MTAESLDIPAPLPKAALFYAVHGVRVHPLHGVLPDGTCTCRGSKPGCQPGKHPRVRRWQSEATTDARHVEAWWQQWPNANIGALVPGRHLVLDVDPRHGGCLEALGELPSTRIAHTGGGGWHVYFCLPDGFELPSLIDHTRLPGVPGIDLRTERNYIILPPSRHALGEYQWQTPFDTPIACVPDHLLRRLVSRDTRGQRSSSSLGPGGPTASSSVDTVLHAGERNTQLFRRACALRARGFADASIEAAIRSENALHCDPPLAEDEVTQLLRSSQRYPPNGHDIVGHLQEYRLRPDGALVHVECDAQHPGQQERERVVADVAVRLVGRVVDVEDGQRFLRVAWWEESRWHEYLAERDVVMNATKLVNLSRYGVPVRTSTARLLVDYLARYEHVNRAHLPEEQIVSRMGWHVQDQRAVYLWGHGVIGEGTLRFHPREGSAGDAQLAAGLSAAGTLTGWMSVVKPVARCTKALFALYAALTPPLLRFLNVPTFFVHWHGRTSLGKTTTLLLAASAAGKPDSAHGLVQSWNSTHVNIERLCSVCTDLPVFLDDTKSTATRAVGLLLYKASSGVGKGRGTLAGRAALTAWRTVILSTGEGRLTDLTADGGARGRVVEFGGSPFVTDTHADLVRALKAGVRHHYGHALPLFVRYLQSHLEDAQRWLRLHSMVRHSLSRGRSNVADRLAEYFAAVRVAAVLFHRACREAGHRLPWDVPRFEEEWHAVAEGTRNADTDVRALAHVLSWARSNEESFQGRHATDSNGQPQTPRIGWAGRWDADPEWAEIGFLPNVLKTVLEKGGFFDVEAIRRSWAEREWLRLDGEGRDPQFRWKADERGRERVRLIAIQRHAFRTVGAQD